MVKPGAYVAWLKDLERDDIHLVGGKAANIGEMIQANLPVPIGFAVTTTAYTDFLRANNLEKKIDHLIGTVNFNDPNSLLQISRTIKKLVNTAPIPDEITRQIFTMYGRLDAKIHDPLVAIRSSLLSDTNMPSESYLNIKGEAALMAKIREVWSQLFDVQEISSRQHGHTNRINGKIALVVQKMIQSEASGILFTIDPLTNNKNKVIINAIFGLGEYLEEGLTLPDLYEVDKKRLEIMNKQVVLQDTMLTKARTENKVVSVPKKFIRSQKISDDDIITLTQIAKQLEKHYFFPQDCEWAKEGGKIFVVETKQITTTGIQEKPKKGFSDIPLKALAIGEPIRRGIGIGPIRILQSVKDMKTVMRGDVIVLKQIASEYIPVLRKGAALICESNVRNAQIAQLFRELEIPTVIGVSRVRKILSNGMVVSVNGRTGEIIRGHLNRKDSFFPESVLLPTKTKVFVTLDSTRLLEMVSSCISDGVGILKADCLIQEFGMHPKRIVHEKSGDLFVDAISDSVMRVCRSIYPNPVFYRFSDMDTDEYRKLSGGRDFELSESNPLLGYHGAYRHIHDPKVFELELKAIHNVRDRSGLNNLNLIIPSVRSVRELEQIKQLINDFGMRRSSTFQLYASCSTPANLFMLGDFIRKGIDGVSIDVDILATLLTGTDIKNDEVLPAFEHNNQALLWALEKAITECKTNGVAAIVHSSILSLNSDLIERLVDWGVTAVSVSSRDVDLTREFVYKAERRMIK